MKIILTKKYAQTVKRDLGLKLLNLQLDEDGAVSQVGKGLSQEGLVPPHLIEEAIEELDEQIAIMGFIDPRKSKYYQRIRIQLQEAVPKATSDVSSGIDHWIH